MHNVESDSVKDTAHVRNLNRFSPIVRYDKSLINAKTESNKEARKEKTQADTISSETLFLSVNEC